MSMFSSGAYRPAQLEPLFPTYREALSPEERRYQLLRHEGAGLYPSEFMTRFVYMPHTDSSGRSTMEPFSFAGREYLIPIYDTEFDSVLMIFGRQMEKSTTLSGQALSYVSLRTNHRELYVSPSQQQTEVFSRDKVAAHIRNSPKLQLLKGPIGRYVDNVLYKEFITGSSITFKYAFLTADRTRGVTANALRLDEMQNIDIDIVPVIEETLSHSPIKKFFYAGTPLSLDNTINRYWVRFSTQNEWVIPCDACNHWNVPGMPNIGKTHLICEKCGRRIYPNHPKARWVSMRSPEWLANPPVARVFNGFHLPQIIASWIKWPEIIGKMENYSVAAFHNEVLALSYDSSMKLLTLSNFQAQCDPALPMRSDGSTGHGVDLFMGIDWGGGGAGESSFTAVAIGGYIGGRFTYLYVARFEGVLNDSQYFMPAIHNLISVFRPRLIGTDYGGGLEYNAELIRAYGLQRIMRYQYCAAKLMHYDPVLCRYMVNKTEVCTKFAIAIKVGNNFRFPRYEDFEDPAATDCCAVVKEPVEGRSTGTVYHITKSVGSTDDCFHGMLYAFLVSMIVHKRPDILTPTGDPELDNPAEEDYRYGYQADY